MDAIILSIGSELMLGQTVDTNAAWLSQRLAAAGIPVLAHITIADELEPIREQMVQACARADVVLVTGGIGPTEDDLTREALAGAMGVPLEQNEECVRQIRAFFASRSRPMPEANLVQALLPRGSEAMENTCGTAPGIKADCRGATVFVMPGVPREMKIMYDRSVHPLLAAQTGGSVILARTLYCFGAGESEIGERIADLMQRGRNPAVGTTAQQTVIGVRIHARGGSPEEAGALLEETSTEVQRRLGSLIFGQDDPAIEKAVGALLKAGGRTVSTAESCTGGLISKRLTDVPGSSAYYTHGLVTYSNRAKVQFLGISEAMLAEHGAVSAQVAASMAVSCRRMSGTDFAISVTGIAGPDGGSVEKPVGLVYIGLAEGTGCTVTEHRLGDSLAREEVRDRTCKAALNRLRLRLLELQALAGQ